MISVARQRFLALLAVVCGIALVHLGMTHRTTPVQSNAQAAASLQSLSDLIPDGTYQMLNHPQGNQAPPPFCLQLDRLFGPGPGYGTITFNCEHPDSDVKVEVTGSSLTMSGDLYGGRDRGTDYQPGMAGLWKFEMTYGVLQKFDTDDDLYALGGDALGTLIPQFSTPFFDVGDVFYITDYNGQFPFSFRLGNKDDDQGKGNYPGISGWGWLEHGRALDDLQHPDASDWNFVIEPICEVNQVA